MKGSARDLINNTLSPLNDELIEGAKRYSKIMKNQGSKITAVQMGSASFEGVFEMDREGNSRFALSASSPAIPVSGVPVDASADGGVNKEFKAVSSSKVKIEFQSTVTIEREDEI